MAAFAFTGTTARSEPGQPLWGVSVFCALDDIGSSSLSALLQRFASYRAVHLARAGQLRHAGFELLTTFGRPHFTVRATSDHPDELGRLLEALGDARAQPLPWSKTRTEVTVVSVDITCDLMDEDETGHVWTFLREARDPALIEPGAIVVAGDEDAPAVAEVVDIVEKPAGKVVHLRVLPGAIEDYEALVRRTITPA